MILNDNNMAIDQATGALKNYLLKISTSVHYNRFKQQFEKLKAIRNWPYKYSFTINSNRYYWIPVKEMP